MQWALALLAVTTVVNSVAIVVNANAIYKLSTRTLHLEQE